MLFGRGDRKHSTYTTLTDRAHTIKSSELLTKALFNSIYPLSRLRNSVGHYVGITHQTPILSEKHFTSLEVLLPELKVDLLARRLLTRLLDIPCRDIWSAEIHTHVCPQRALQPVHICAVQQPVAHAAQQTREVGTPEVRSALELSEGILICADRVQDDVLRGVCVHLLCQVGVDTQELVAVALADGLGFER